MRSTRPWVACSFISVLLALGACGDDDGPPDVDAGGGVDGGDGVDAGPGLDAGEGTDAGHDASTADTGAGVDAGTDAGRTDAGPPDFDSGFDPIDAGDPFPDAGELGPPEWVPIRVITDPTQMCEPLAPCGGDVVGTWDVAGGCVEVPVPMELMMCPGATVVGRGQARGRVVFEATVAARLAQVIVEARATIPNFCLSVAGFSCSDVEDLISMGTPPMTDVRCVEMGSGFVGNCICDLRTVQIIDDGGAYTTTATQIQMADTSKNYDYCVDGDMMRYEDTDTSSSREPGIIELVRR